MSTAIAEWDGKGDRGDWWHRLLRAALAMPKARVDRASYLRVTLSKHAPAETVELAIASTPAKAGIPASLICRLAKSSMSRHRTGVTAASVAAGLPGGWGMAATIPADLAQFYWHISVILQKLAYLYGWPELFKDGQEIDDETLHLFTIFVGVMAGAEGAGKLLVKLADKLAQEAVNRLPRMALTKWGLYTLSKQIAKWIGVKLTKTSFARIVAKAPPFLAGVTSGYMTWIAFSKMSSRLQEHLAGLQPARP